jgi:hypothetical protein
LPAISGASKKNASHIAAGPVKALHRSGRDGVGFEVNRDDRNGLRRLPRSLKTSRCDGKNDVYAVSH